MSRVATAFTVPEDPDAEWVRAVNLRARRAIVRSAVGVEPGRLAVAAILSNKILAPGKIILIVDPLHGQAPAMFYVVDSIEEVR